MTTSAPTSSTPTLWEMLRTQRRFSLQRTDGYLLMLSFGLALFGWLMITSASMDFAQQNMGSPFALMQRHGVYLALAVIGFTVTVQIPLAVWYRLGAPILLLGFVLLVLVLVPGIGREVNGSSRWINLGFIQFQPSELAKLAIILYVAGYLVRRQEEVRTSFSGFLKPLLVVAAMTVLLLAEPDFGAVVVVMTTIMGMMFLGGVRAGQFFVTVAVAIISAGLMAITQTYRVQRLMSFTNPWSEENVFGSGYQLTQALIAFGRGEWFGVGLGNSLQKLFYLPEAHTDFIVAIIAEELGLFGILAMLGALTWLVVLIVRIGWQADQRGQSFGAFICFGIAMVFALQIFINVGVNSGLLPTKGLTLPLVSYGGTSLLVSFAMIGLVARVATELGDDASISQGGQRHD
ncbi:putative lipid II flippase FtsW [Salinispirillum marinum]|uniref:Probable peptidoglycan glycosyltransferase FtsW n=2 Tax=Saccharospirillaceae TaxID=255527 RepID=A0ABV8BD09_9GAMM